MEWIKRQIMRIEPSKLRIKENNSLVISGEEHEVASGQSQNHINNPGFVKV